MSSLPISSNSVIVSDRRLDEKHPEGCIEDITIANITGISVETMAPNITGYPGNPVRRVVIRDINLEFEGGLEADKILAEIPDKSNAYPEIHMLTRHHKEGGRLPAYGTYIRDVEDIAFRNIHFRLRSEDARKPFVMERVEGAVFENIQAPGF